MGRGKVVKAPDGALWRVRRRWLDRPLPRLWRRFKESRNEDLEDGALGALPNADWAEGWWGIAIPIAAILIVFVLLPLLGVALELIALIFVFCFGLIGRLFFGRPWIVEAVPQDGGDGKGAVAFPVKGWRRAGETVDRLALEIAAAGRPDRFVAAPG
ncbi:MAG TPA: hypothetical protein VN522_09545 [Solirubrobacterales bacterium]|nr:hypothetical protein [Solirubrobacterales bacterium]